MLWNKLFVHDSFFNYNAREYFLTHVTMKGGTCPSGHCAVGKTAVLLLIVGGLNWGLVGAFDYNLVNAIFVRGLVVEQVLYILVGLAALWKLFFLCKKCMK